MREVFVGSEAVAAGRISEHELRRWYQPVFRDVYMPKSVQLSLRDRTECAWLWSKRRAVIAGVAAAALHGAQWIDPGEPVELIAPSARRQEGLIVRNEALAENEITKIAGLRVTTPARTAFDLGRHLPVDAAITRIDALQHAIMFSLTMSGSWRRAQGSTWNSPTQVGAPARRRWRGISEGDLAEVAAHPRRLSPASHADTRDGPLAAAGGSGHGLAGDQGRRRVRR